MAVEPDCLWVYAYGLEFIGEYASLSAVVRDMDARQQVHWLAFNPHSACLYTNEYRPQHGAFFVAQYDASHRLLRDLLAAPSTPASLSERLEFLTAAVVATPQPRLTQRHHRAPLLRNHTP